MPLSLFWLGCHCRIAFAGSRVRTLETCKKLVEFEKMRRSFPGRDDGLHAERGRVAPLLNLNWKLWGTRGEGEKKSIRNWFGVRTDDEHFILLYLCSSSRLVCSRKTRRKWGAKKKICWFGLLRDFGRERSSLLGLLSTSYTIYSKKQSFLFMFSCPFYLFNIASFPRFE